MIKTIKYGESSAISKILTEQYGLLGFHIPGAYKSKSKISISYLQPLTDLEISFHYTKTGNLYKISDIRCLSFADPGDMRRRALYHVCCEILQQTIRENEVNRGLFQYLSEEAIPGLSAELHFWQLPFVLLNILHHYGCSPNADTYGKGAYLDLQNGVFCETLLPLRHIADPESSEAIHTMLTKGISNLEHNGRLRSMVIQDLIRYFRYHVREDFDLRSMEVYAEMK